MSGREPTVRKRHQLAPLAVVAATDMLLVALLASPWAVAWGTITAAEVYTVHDYVVSPAVSPLILPVWEQEPDNYRMLAIYMDRWRAGTTVRIVVFLLLHLWVVRQLIQRDPGDTGGTGDGAWRAARTGAWVLGPAVGALAGLATVIPAALDMSVTAEERSGLRAAGIVSLGEGAYGGLVAGAACAITLTAGRAAARVAARLAAQPGRVGDAAGADQTLTFGQVLGHALRAAAAGVAAGGVLVAVFGGPLLAQPPPPPTSGPQPSWAELVTHVHWWTDGLPGSDLGAAGAASASFATPLFLFAAAATALAAYLWALLVLLTISAIATRPLPPLRRFLSGWHAVTGAVLVYTLITAWTQAVAVSPGDGVATVVREAAGTFLTDLHPAATYTAILGWIPALAMLAASLRRRSSRPSPIFDEWTPKRNLR